jgi:hypothetical protein
MLPKQYTHKKNTMNRKKNYRYFLRLAFSLMFLLMASLAPIYVSTLDIPVVVSIIGSTLAMLVFCFCAVILRFH